MAGRFTCWLVVFDNTREIHMDRYVIFRKYCKPPEYGGAEKRLLQWLDLLDYEHCSVTVCTSRGSAHLYRQRIGKDMPVNFIEYDLKKGFLGTFVTIYRMIRKCRPKVVYFIDGGFRDFNIFEVAAAYLVAPRKVRMIELFSPPKLPKRSSKKHLGFLPGLGLWWYKEVYQYSLRHFLCRKIYANSVEVKDSLVRSWFYKKKKIEVITHGVDTVAYAPSKQLYISMREKHNIANKSKVIISTARLATEKRVDRLFD
ncbi:glycosyltransferase, partial [Candidatus Omnitrophota bacterium]